MEKIVAALWAPAGQSRAEFGRACVASLPQRLQTAGAAHIRLNIRDEVVDPAAPLVQQWQQPQPDAIAQFWMPSANDRFRGEIDTLLAAKTARVACWLVSESTIIANRVHPPAPATRTYGWSQATLLTFRPDMTREAALTHWLGHHTQVAIDTQANFEYVQNLIVRPLTPDAPAYDAFIEECFPPDAMTSQPAFFDATGDQGRFERNLKAMMDSCVAFIDFTRLDVMPSSQYNWPGSPVARQPQDS